MILFHNGRFFVKLFQEKKVFMVAYNSFGAGEGGNIHHHNASGYWEY
jgi:hypothetical protein